MYYNNFTSYWLVVYKHRLLKHCECKRLSMSNDDKRLSREAKLIPI